MSTASKFFVVPKQGLTLSFRGGEKLPPGGALRPALGDEGAYWRRRERDGDVCISDAPKAAKPKQDPKHEPKKAE